MSVRFRLFLWIGILFFLAFGFAGIWQMKITDKNLVKASTDLKEKLFELNDLKRVSVEKYVRLALANQIAEIQALLETVSTYKIYERSFVPLTDQGYNWAHNADLLLDNKWIDFVQNMSKDRVLSVLIPDIKLMQRVNRKNIDENFCWINFDDKSEVYLGIRMQNLQGEEKIVSMESKKMTEQLVAQEDPHMYLIFSKESLSQIVKTFTKAASSSPSTYINPSFFSYYGVKDIEEFILSFSMKMDRALGLIPAWPGSVHEVPFPQENLAQTYDNAPIQIYLQELINRHRMIAMILLLSSYYTIDITGDNPSASTSPFAVGYFNDGLIEGQGFFAKDVFKTTAYATQSSSENISLIPDLEQNKVYIGQTAEIRLNEDGNVKTTSLTVGIDPEVFGKLLAISNNDIIFLLSQKRVISGFDKSGDPLEKSDLSFVDADTLSLKHKGFESWKGEDYFFLQITPFTSIDLHYILCTPTKQAFAVLNFVEEGTKDLISTISSRMREVALFALILVLLCLNYVSKRMTKPIIQLSKAAQKVAAGNLEQPDISYKMGSKKDEISVLCESFMKMIQGLIEKEKVRSVLNKVVSPQIASQILETPIHLGGEEKLMTILFADIRGFTHLTESMAPRDVIEMLNSCMTKVAEPIDRFGGVIDKYVGDEVMVLFGLPEHKKNTVIDAVNAALEMHRKMEEWNQERKLKNLPFIQLGIGIHTGNVVAGNMGAENRLNYTVLGSHVNLGARLCSMAKAGQILVSEAVAADPEVAAALRLEKIESLAIKGFSHPITIYNIVGRI